LNVGNQWGEWKDAELFQFGFRCDSYRFRRPIAKAAQWVACTAEEARANPKVSEFYDVNERWFSCLESWSLFEKRFAHRTTAQLSEWVEVSSDVFAAICARDDSHLIEKSASRDTGRKLRRSTVPCGTVLG
jgi:S-methylmethionine-dependent homocysteine/selenocysteine methylase